MKVSRIFFKIAIILLFLQGCASSGKRTTAVDEFNGTKSHYLTLGSVKSTNSSFITEILLKIGVDDTSQDNYYLILDSYVEGTGKECPGANPGNEVIFLADSNKISTRVISSSHPSEMRPGLLLPSCQEANIKIGYLKKSDLELMTQATELKFKIYSSRHPLQASFKPDQLKLIREFMNEDH